MSETIAPTPSAAANAPVTPATSAATPVTPTPPQLAETPEATPSAPITLNTPFEHIALAFSGGGFRAASFSLGVLSYFDSLAFTDTTGEPVTLLQKIRFISSASGGTITNACFALAVAEGKTFKEFFDNLYGRLQGDQMLQTALQHLNSSQPWRERPHKGRNLINAFALCYDELLFDHKTLAHLQSPNQQPASQQTPNQQSAKQQTSNQQPSNQQPSNQQSPDQQPATPASPQPNPGMRVPLEEVCFNATEFFRGLPFRQNIKLLPDPSPDQYFFYGNNYLRLDAQVSTKIRIADTMAASSCFPMGFEPLRFPDDFAHEDLTPQTLHSAMQPNKKMLTDEECAFLEKNNIGLMDGGITDNQGLDSLIIADDRRIAKQTSFAPFDLLIVNDVGSQYMQPYCVPSVNKKSLPGQLTYTHLRLIFWLLAVITIGLGIAGYTSDHPVGKIAFTAGAGLLLGILIVSFWFGRYLPEKLIKDSTNNFSPDAMKTLLSFFRGTRLSVVMQMLSARISSAITLNSDVFLKRVRSLIYNSFYENPHWISRRKGNHIYDLSFTNDLNRKAHSPSPDITPTKAIQTIAQKAYEMPTTLWFDKSEEFSLPTIVACGHFNTCYNLLDYTQRLLSNKALMENFDPGYKERVIQLNALLNADWKKFNDDPFWLLNKTYPGKPLTIVGENINYLSTT